MPRSRIVYFVIASLAVGGLAGAVQAQPVLYGMQHAGSDGPSTLYAIDHMTGMATMVGAVGFERCGGMDFDSSGTLYAACERNDGSDTPVLVTVDTTNGAGTEIGPTGITGAISDLSFRNGDGTLFAFDASNDPEHTLFTLNTGTGAATLVGDTGLGFDGGNGMTFDLADLLWHSAASGSLNMLDQTNGMASFVTAVTLPPGVPAGSRMASKDAHPTTGVVWAGLKEGFGSGSPSDLVTLDTTTGVVSLVAPTIIDLDGIAWLSGTASDTPVVEIPTLNAWSLMGLAVILMGVGVLVLRRHPLP